MKNKHSKQSYRLLLLSLGITLGIFIIGIRTIESLDIQKSLKHLIIPLIRLTLFISLGLAFGQFVEATGWTRTISTLARPLFKFSRLGDLCASVFMTAFISGVSANAMLVSFYKDKKITKQQVYITNFINHLPGFFLHFPTSFFIVIPLTGQAGVIYFLITFGAMIFRVSLFLLYGHFFLPLSNEYSIKAKQSSSLKKKGIWRSIQKKLPPRIIRIFVWVLPIYTAVYVLNTAGLFQFLNTLLSGFILTKIVPVESLSIVVLSFVAEFTSGFAAAGALLNSGVITVKQTVIALLAGNIIAFPLRALRHQLPRYMGIFSPKMGIIMLAAGQFFRVTSLLILGTLFYLFF